MPPHMRAQAAAVLLLILNLIGLGAGPQFVGWLSEQLKPAHGIESVRYALLYTIVIGVMDDPKNVGWWDTMIGPGKPIDTQ